MRRRSILRITAGGGGGRDRKEVCVVWIWVVGLLVVLVLLVWIFPHKGSSWGWPGLLELIIGLVSVLLGFGLGKAVMSDWIMPWVNWFLGANAILLVVSLLGIGNWLLPRKNSGWLKVTVGDVFVAIFGVLFGICLHNTDAGKALDKQVDIAGQYVANAWNALDGGQKPPDTAKAIGKETGKTTEPERKPEPPPAPPPPIVDDATVARVQWHVTDKKLVTFPPLQDGKKWAIAHGGKYSTTGQLIGPGVIGNGSICLTQPDGSIRYKCYAELEGPTVWVVDKKNKGSPVFPLIPR